MNKKIYLIVLIVFIIFIFSGYLYSMENSFKAFSLRFSNDIFFDLSEFSEITKKRLLAPMEISLQPHAVFYVGECQQRRELERIYDLKFSINTIFFNVRWTLPRLKTELSDGKLLPTFIPYEFIRDKKEGDAVILPLNGTDYQFICRQHRVANFMAHLSFEELLTYNFKDFINNPKCFFDGPETLEKEKVVYIAEKRFFHGENASPFVKEING